MIWARPYGKRPGDLNIDFSEPRRPFLISRLLLACLEQADGRSYPEDGFCDWTLRRRLQGLLAIVVATKGRQLRVQAPCEHSSCGELIELNLDLVEFCDVKRPDTFFCEPVAKTKVQIRLPSGADQIRWLDANDRGRGCSFAEMATALITEVNGRAPDGGWRVPGEWLEDLGRTLEEHDPLMTLRLDTCCPVCHGEMQIEFDLEHHLLTVLAAEQQYLLGQIHRLASSYHWPEAEILALSSQRRAYYIARIDGEASG